MQGRLVWGKGTRSFLPRWLLLECPGLSQQKYISVLSLKLQGQAEAGGKWRWDVDLNHHQQNVISASEVVRAELGGPCTFVL